MWKKIVGVIAFIASVFGILQFFNISLNTSEPNTHTELINNNQSGGISANNIHAETIINSTGIDHRKAAQPPSTENIKRSIQAMIHDVPESSQFRIHTVTTPVNGVVAVAIEPPYREFPNVVLFNFKYSLNKWVRVYEGLSVGLQAHVSGILDLHTKGYAVDLINMLDKDKEEIMASIVASGGVPIPYEKFIHSHVAGREAYYIDKHNFPRFAKQLEINGDFYPDDNCTIFDMPKLEDISLSHESGRYKLVGHTMNEQEWVITFSGISENGYLTNRMIYVRKMK